MKVKNRIRYYNALDKAHTTNNNMDFVEIVKEEVENMLDLYLKLI